MQDLSKTFHYAWLFLSIVLVAWELPEDNQFPSITLDLPEAAKYASLWATKDANRICDSKIFWVFMEMNIRMGINHKPRLSSIVYKNLQRFIEFKVDFHHICLRACKETTKKWSELPFIATDDVIFDVLQIWPLEWCTPDIAAVEKPTTQKKNEAKLHMA